MKSPLLARLILFGFVAIFVVAASYLLLDALGIWSRLPAALTRDVDLATGLVLLFALGAHLLLATGRLPAEDAPRRDSRV